MSVDGLARPYHDEVSDRNHLRPRHSGKKPVVTRGAQASRQFMILGREDFLWPRSMRIRASAGVSG
jgi:hypothetical protein